MAIDTTLVCRGIRRAYRVGTEIMWALWDVDAVARSGEMTVLAGPSGSGKSTLLRVMAGIDVPDTGSVEIAGTEISSLSRRRRDRFRSRHIGYLFQDPAANLLSYLTVWEHVAMVAEIRSGIPRSDLLAHLEIADLADELPQHLSAGQQQRAALVASLVGRPEVILADEPTAELDSRSASLAVDALMRMRDMGGTLVVASHDADVIEVADHVIGLDRGVIQG